MPQVQPWPKARSLFFEQWRTQIGSADFADALAVVLDAALVAGAGRARDRFVRELYTAAAEFDAMAHEDPAQREQYRTIAARIREVGTVMETLTARDLAQVVGDEQTPRSPA